MKREAALEAVAVSIPFECPPADAWLTFLDSSVPPDERQRFEQHLESCACCQSRLDEAEPVEPSLRTLGQTIGDPTLVSTDPALTQIVARLCDLKGASRTSAAEASDLYFLSPTDRPELLGILGDYEIREVIGHGGMGVVFKAFDPALHRLVAIKVLAAGIAGSPTARQRFALEARATAAVFHDHIVAVH